MKATLWLYLETELHDLQNDFESVFNCSLEMDSEDYWEWIHTIDNEINISRPHNYMIGKGLYEKPIEIRINGVSSNMKEDDLGKILFNKFQTTVFQGNIKYLNHKEFILEIEILYN